MTSRYPVGISTEFCFRWQKNRQGGKGRGEKGKKKKKKKTGEKTEEEKSGKGKKKHGGRENRTAVARIDLAQESNALPVTYCDSQASL